MDVRFRWFTGNMESNGQFGRLVLETTMALKKTITTESGLEAVGAYHRVEALMLTSKTEMRFNIRSYVVTNLPFFTEQVLTAPYDLEGANPIKQAYEQVKKLDAFAGAEDV